MANEIRCGHRIKLRHFASGNTLHSHNINYTHPGTSGQQQVTCYQNLDANDFWVVKMEMVDEFENHFDGKIIQHGDIIRLEHFMTGRNLHSHNGIQSPVTHQQEVTCFGVDGIGDGNDSWRIEIENGGNWELGKKVKFVHVPTGFRLHSHAGVSSINFTAGQQEVTAYNQPDNNDWWVVFEKGYEGFPVINKTGKHISGFRPTTRAFKFGNNFPDTPLFNIPAPPVPPPLPPLPPVPYNTAGNGVCGGMVYAVRDYFENGLLVPSSNTWPATGSAVFNYIRDRLIESFNIPTLGFNRYYEFMDPTRPANEPVHVGPISVGKHCKGWMILNEEWPKIKQDIDTGHLCCLGLVLLISGNPADIGHNHQVIAYGYEQFGNDIFIKVYDPNEPMDDSVRLSFNNGNPNSDFTINYTRCGGKQLTNINGSVKVFGFFKSEYHRTGPPAQTVATSHFVHFKTSAGNFLVAENGGGSTLKADRTTASTWEKFAIEKVGTDPLSHDDIIQIKTANGNYIVAEQGGGSTVKADRTTPRAWEHFQIKKVEGSSHTNSQDTMQINDGNIVALKAFNEQYVCAENGGGGIVNANRDIVGDWESFTIIFA